MPNLNEIAKFRKELKNIAQEDKITASWGGPVYDELSPPDPKEVPEVDLDALLPSAESETTSADERIAPAASSDPIRPSQEEGTATETPLSENDILSDAGLFDTSPAPNIPDVPADSAPSDVSDGAVSGDTSSADDDFEDFLSSFNFDDLSPDSEPASDDAGTETAGFDGADTNSVAPAASNEDGLTDAGNTADAVSAGNGEDGNTASDGSDDPFNFDEMLSSLDFNAEPKDDMPQSGSGAPIEEAAASPESPSPDAAETGEPFGGEDDGSGIDLSSFDFSDAPTEDTAASSESPSPDAAKAGEPSGGEDDGSGIDLSSFDFSDAPTEDAAASAESDSPVNSETDTTDDLENMEELLFSEKRDDADNEEAPLSEETDDSMDNEEAAPSDGTDNTVSGLDMANDIPDTGTAETVSEPAPSEDAGFEGLPPSGMSDDLFTPQPEGKGGEQSGFSLEENPLDSNITEVTDDQFNLPDNFKDFSAVGPNRMFDSVIAKSTISDADGKDALSISDDEYFQFLNQLESFPLNVQLAIQDYIGNGEDTPENKMDFIRFMLAKDSLKKIVKKLEKILNKSIPIPKGFQRKSVEEYEREKKTFKYWALHKLLPVAVMSLIALILVFCISVLSWQFIYKPVMSESFYKEGYAYLENEQYETAIEKFNKAGEYKKKRGWYFSYARAFRQKRQFTAAEKMYNRLIYDFDHDKQGGLEYAEMLSTDLRNYEKAETVLRRQLLDQHVNDKDGLLALGDVYMDWADEDPEKYDTAVKIYSRLIELYGESDTFLIRMLRYFIRTDNLAEVLNLKKHFSSSIVKIGATDLTELSGYLLEKRYNPKPLDSERLRTQIDDVRMLLEKAVQTDKSLPDAYYNLGRFFIYNNRQDGAIENLTEAIKRFETEAPMTARRTVRHVDAMRLLGEQLVTQKKYLDAQALYADALNIYREYTSFKPLPPNQLIGKLYADYGDIDYFISYNFDSALDSYQHAVKELYNTPSINYRIGYIHYQQENYQDAIEAMSLAKAEKGKDRHLLYGFGNTFFKRGDYFAASAIYEQLLGLLNAQRARRKDGFSNVRPDETAFIEEYMHTATNLGATLNRLAERTGDSQKNGRALALYAEATRAWDALTRNPETMIRAKSVGLAYLNIQNMLSSKSPYDSEIYTDIPMILENERPLEQKEDK